MNQRLGPNKKELPSLEIQIQIQIRIAANAIFFFSSRPWNEVDLRLWKINRGIATNQKWRNILHE